MYILKIKVLDPTLIEKYQSAKVAYDGDCGIDLYCPDTVTIPVNSTHLLDLKIQCEMIDSETMKNVSYYLYPRSSIYKSNFMMHNSVGIIDSKYRGNIKVPLRCCYNDSNNTSETTAIGKCYVQICGPTLGEISVELVNELSSTVRGERGFGSSGN